MYTLLKYKIPAATHVKFQRIIMGWLAIAALFGENINLVWVFFTLTAIGMLTGTEYSPVSLFYKLIKKLFSFDLVKISQHHIRYYEVGTSVDFIDHLLRIIASGSALLLFSFDLHMAAWAMLSFLSIFMMLSAYFGFCLSALSYIFLQNITSVKGSSCDIKPTVNKNCTLAKHCFTPYKRCDSCHVDITQCLGTKYNTTVLLIGLLMPLFLFVENRYVIELNIVLIMGLIFWLGYQVNYSTDDLAKSNDDNIQLNKKLRAYNVSLEAEVQKRTSEIEHLVIHDRLTNAFNRYWFEKRVTQALEEIHSDEKHYVLAFLDLDKFKAVNDTAGHLAGDELLRNVTSLIKEIISQKDYFARLGGDEFAILFETDTKESIDNAVATCNKICQAIDAYRFDWEGHAFQIGVSIGVVNATNDIQNLTELFRKADKACYGAKNAGRNRVVVYSETI
jgi:diguanylate cyclase (GGDEF)-like protein